MKSKLGVLEAKANRTPKTKADFYHHGQTNLVSGTALYARLYEPLNHHVCIGRLFIVA